MARYTGPVNKKMRFLGLEIAKKSGKNRMSPRRRLSPYGLQLREKQKARFLYGILERQFRNYYDKASNKKIFIMGINHAEFYSNSIIREWVLFDEVAIWKQILINHG